MLSTTSVHWTAWRGWPWIPRITFLQLLSFPRTNQDWYIFQVIVLVVSGSCFTLWFLTSSMVMQREFGTFHIVQEACLSHQIQACICFVFLNRTSLLHTHFDFHREVIAGKEFDRSVWISNCKRGFRTEGVNLNSQKTRPVSIPFWIGSYSSVAWPNHLSGCSGSVCGATIPFSCLFTRPQPHVCLR